MDMKTSYCGVLLAFASFGLAGCVCGLHRGTADHQASLSKVGLLGGTRWDLLEVGGRRVNPDSVKAQPYVEFAADGRLSGMAGCNGMFGIYEADSENLKIDGLGTTKMLCPTGMETESRLVEVLNQPLRYGISRDTLSLHDQNLTMLAKFVAGKSDK